MLLIVPFGSTALMLCRCTFSFTSLATSRVTNCSATPVMRPTMPPGSHYFVTLRKSSYKRPVLFGALALGAYHHEIHDAEDQHHGENHRQHAGAFAPLLGPGGLNQYVERHDV